MADDAQPTTAPGISDKGLSSFLAATKIPTAEETEKKETALFDQHKKERQPFLDQSARLMKQQVALTDAMSKIAPPKAPEFAKLPDAPNAELRDPTQSLGSLGSVLAVFGSMRTRAPMTAALNAMSASMEGFRKGDKERVALERQKWQDNMQKGLRQNQEEMQQYTTALEAAKFDMSKAQGAFRAIAAQNEHNSMMAAIEAGDFKTQMQILDSGYKAGTKAAEMFVKDQEFRMVQDTKREQNKQHDERMASAQADRRSAKEDRRTQYDIAHGTNLYGGNENGVRSSPLNEANANLHGEEFLKKIPQADRVSVEGLLKYDIDPKTIPPRMIEIDGQKQSRREYLMGLARQVDPTYSETSYREKTTALNEFQRTKGNAVRFLNVSIDHIDTAAEYGKALKNGDTQKLNQLKNWWETQTGTAAPNTFNGIKDIVASEVIKGAIGGPGGVEERRENAEKVKAANSPEQLDELFKGWKKLMAGQMKGLEKAYESGTRLTNFREKYMLPRARQALEEVSGDEQPARRSTDPKQAGGGAWSVVK